MLLYYRDIMRTLFTGLLCVLASSTQANVIQYFAGISYNNPSELFKIKNEEFIAGGTGSYANLKFKGTVLNFNTMDYDDGTSYSRTYTLMPYGRIAKRINDKFVFAVDVTQPFNSNLDWGTNSFTKYAVTQNFLYDVDISPKLAYSFNDKLKLGGGINFNFLNNNEINWAFPTGQFTSANLINKSSSYGTGYNLGVTYMINQTNFLGIAYYSKIRQNTSGRSLLGNSYSGDLIFNFTMPATTIISYVHIFNPTWLINLQAYQSEWNVNQYARVFNTAAPAPFSNFTFDMHFRKSYVVFGALRNQFSKNLGMTLVGLIDKGPERDNLRTITFPCDYQYFVGLMGDYHFNASTSVELL